MILIPVIKSFSRRGRARVRLCIVAMNRCLLITIILYNSFPRRAVLFADRENEKRNFFLPLNFAGVQFCTLSETRTWPSSLPPPLSPQSLPDQSLTQTRAANRNNKYDIHTSQRSARARGGVEEEGGYIVVENSTRFSIKITRY